ncbi:hypothetical protein KUCAC02_023713, partial [Chaenocephalus aceratus]
LLQTRCSAKELRCTVEELDGLTKYTIPKDNATGCHFFWTDPNTEQNTANCTETPRHYWTLMGSGILFVLLPLLLAFWYRDHNS